MQYVKGALTEKMHRASRTAAGFILADTEWKPLYANAEAKKIVTYPEAPGDSNRHGPSWGKGSLL